MGADYATKWTLAGLLTSPDSDSVTFTARCYRTCLKITRL